MKAINITAYTEDASQIEALKGVLKAFKIRYTLSKVNDSSESPYSPEFVAMIKQGEQDLADGKGINVTLQELEDLCK